MTNTVGDLALQISQANRLAIANLTECLEQKNQIVLQLCESNGRAIAALADQVSENQRTELDLTTGEFEGL
jgi:Flp pilus assembly protein TadG